MQEIKAWLQNGKDFEAGAALYIKYGSNSFLKSILPKGPTPYTTQKLETELMSLVPATPASLDAPKPQIKDVQPLPKPEEVKPVSDHPNRGDFETYLQYKDAQQNLYRQLERNMIELDLSEKERFLHMTAKQILAIHSKIMDIYKIIDFYDENGKLPNAKATISRTPSEEIQALRVSTSKAKTRLKSSNCQDILQTRQLIENNNLRIIELGGKVRS